MTKYVYQGKNDTRSGFGAGLAELGRTNPNVVALCADLVGSLKMQEFIDENPEQVIQLKGGKEQVLGYLVGQAMKLSQGKANPGQVSQLLFCGDR